MFLAVILLQFADGKWYVFKVENHEYTYNIYVTMAHRCMSILALVHEDEF